MLRIRLRRMGSRPRPFYRIVVSDSRKVPTARAVEEVGYYDPRKTPATLSIDVERVDHWISHGAKPSATVSRLLARARSGRAEGRTGFPPPRAHRIVETERVAKAEPEVAEAREEHAEETAEAAAEAEASEKETGYGQEGYDAPWPPLGEKPTGE